MAKDKELLDHERAHSGVPGTKVRHGADATGRITYVNEHREALGYRKFPKNLAPDKLIQHEALIEEHAPYGNDPWARGKTGRSAGPD